MSKIWIRHIEKLYKNGKGDIQDSTQYQHDPGIKFEENTEEIVENLVDKLVENYGLPDYIYVSPFLRTRQTSELIINVLNKKYNSNPILFYKPEIGEYLGFCKRSYSNQKADIHPFTKNIFKFNLYLGESLKHFKERVYKHFENVKTEPNNIWSITHGIVLSNIYEYSNGKSTERPKPLEYIVFKDDKLFKE